MTGAATTAASPAEPPARLGPRPLPLHLATALQAWTSSRAAFETSRSGSPPWNPNGTAGDGAARRALAEILERAGAAEGGAAAFRAALDAEVARRTGALLDAIAAYRRHPYRRPPDGAGTVWSDGTTRLLAYGDGAGRPLLLVPSLVNRHYVLDLPPGRGLVSHLVRAGYDPYTVDWGRPGEVERGFDLTDYVAGRLEGALDAVLDATGARPGVVGYCMGGLLALALAGRRRRDLSCLVLLATPWDFSIGPAPALVGLWKPMLDSALDALGELPTDIVQAMFYALDPMTVVRKFLKFAEMDKTGPEAEAFVALEDWINDGVPLAAPVAREALFGWYGGNAPARRAWRIAGRPVDPAGIDLPCLSSIPSRDRIVPPASSAALAAALPRSDALRVPLGHIGMAASAGARARAWEPMAAWLDAHTEGKGG